MIKELTPLQEKELDMYREQYRGIGVCTEPTDQSVTVEINKFYERMKKHHPKYIWVDNPYEANVVASAMLSDVDTEATRILDDAIDYGATDGTMISKKIIDSVEKDVKVISQSYIEGNINASWVSYLKFAKHIGVEYDNQDDIELLEIWDSLIRKTGYFFPYEDHCIVCNRATEIYFDENEEVHNENGPAIKYSRTGCDTYAIHGVRVPEYVVMKPETITVEQISNERNAEVKRIMMERMGIGKYLEECGAKLIDGDMTFVSKQNDDRYVPRALMEDNEGRRFLVGTDGSLYTSDDKGGYRGRVFHMQVPKEVKTVSEAASALAGFDENNIIASS